MDVNRQPSSNAGEPSGASLNGSRPSPVLAAGPLRPLNGTSSSPDRVAAATATLSPDPPTLAKPIAIVTSERSKLSPIDVASSVRKPSETARPPLSSKRSEASSSGRSVDPEDWWEDEETDEEDAVAMLGLDPSVWNRLSEVEKAELLRQEKISTYKAAVQEYRQSKRALMRSNNLSIFASTANDEDGQNGPSVSPRMQTRSIDAQNGLGLIPNGHSDLLASPATPRVRDVKSPLLSSPEGAHL